MAVLRSIESKIEGLFEGVFGRAFRTHVQPIELARKLVKEMDDHRNVSVSKVYVPNEYTVYLSPDDRDAVRRLRGRARRRAAGVPRRARPPRALRAARPADVSSTTDDDLAVGEFGIATRLVAGEGQPATAPPPELPVGEPAQTMIYRAPPAPADPGRAAARAGREVVTLTVAGRKHESPSRRVVLGRSREADVRVADVNVSRRHAELRQEDAGYWIVDLGSTNGIEVNGKRIDRARAARRRPHHDRLDRDRVRPLAAVVTASRSRPTRRSWSSRSPSSCSSTGSSCSSCARRRRGWSRRRRRASSWAPPRPRGCARGARAAPSAPARRHEPGPSSEGRTIEVAAPTVVGRDADSGIRLDRDEFASASTPASSHAPTAPGSTISARRTAPS